MRRKPPKIPAYMRDGTYTLINFPVITRAAQIEAAMYRLEGGSLQARTLEEFARRLKSHKHGESLAVTFDWPKKAE